MTKELLVNAMITPDGTYLESRYRHDYQEHEDTISGELYIIDGGLDYCRQTVNKVPAKMITIYNTDPHHYIREHFKWGTYGVDGLQPLNLVALKDLTSNHIENILEYCKPVGKIEKVFLDELQYREDEGISSPEEGSY